MVEDNEGGVRVEGIVRRLEQYLRKASFSSESDRFSALECFAGLIRALPDPKTCPKCGGSGWVIRDPDIGTDRECPVCQGSGLCE